MDRSPHCGPHAFCPGVLLLLLLLWRQVPHYVPISAKDEWNFDELLEKIWEYAKMIRM